MTFSSCICRPALSRFTRLGALSVSRPFSASASSQLARITLVGRLAATPELQGTSTGSEIVRYAVGHDTGPADRRTTTWFKVVAFDQTKPPRLMQLEKGTLVYLEGEPNLHKYQTDDGNPHHKFNIVQRSLIVLRNPTHPAGEGAAATEAEHSAE
ncbi:MAG: hypothetical protein M1823_005685 [Watsoniomyces obsoletus]|nr:MAG: hypothetical protein M1823_005685 [Watsoniomyces obsoletus]